MTWRISGLFRDLFPAQIALIDAAVRLVAEREEDDEENPLAADHARTTAARRPASSATRLALTAPAPRICSAATWTADEVGAAYLAAASHAYGGAEGEGRALPGGVRRRACAPPIFCCMAADDPARDLLEGSEDAAFIGGFASAAASLGNAPELIVLDVTDAKRPRARTLDAALARIVRSRAVNPRFIEGQMRHGARGAAELAETVDRLVDFAETTGKVASALFDLVHDAYLGDARVRAFLMRENPEAARAIAERLEAARRKGLWHPRRNDLDTDLSELRPEAAEAVP